jgi:ATPase subunit of ABC transporter with duplicated ATPase domains
MLVSQEVVCHNTHTPINVILQNHGRMNEKFGDSNRLYSIARVEEEMDALDKSANDYAVEMEHLCNLIAELEEDDNNNSGERGGHLEERARNSLRYFGVPLSTFDIPTAKLSGGIRKKVALACAIMERPQLLLLDEPICHIDIGGIIHLRRMISDFLESNVTVVLVSHDVNLMNDVAVINMRDSKLTYYPGCNYRDYVNRRREGIANQVRQSGVLEKQRSAMMASIDIMKKKSHQADSGMTKKKIDSAIKSKEKKLERHGVEKNDKGHRRVAQTDGGIRKGSINSVGASLRNTLTHRELLKLAEINVGPVPDKAVQFDFANVSSTWGDEPLCMVMDMGHGYNDDGGSILIFDCVDLAIREDHPWRERFG